MVKIEQSKIDKSKNENILLGKKDKMLRIRFFNIYGPFIIYNLP